MKPEELVDLVSDLNSELYAQLKDEEHPVVKYMTDGNCDVIEFLDGVLWTSEDVHDEWDPECTRKIEDLGKFIRGKINTVVGKVSMIKL